jgi:hypothetical protein
MQGKFRFSLDGVDATSRQFSEVRRQLRELSADVSKRVEEVGKRVVTVEDDLGSLIGEQDQANVYEGNAVIVPAHGGTGVRDVYSGSLLSSPLRPVYCLPDGRLGTDHSSACSVVNVDDADGFIPLDALRRVKWRVYMYEDDLNLRLDNTQPVVGLLAEDLDDAGLGFFCLYDEDSVPVGVDYPKLSIAALRLAQESMDEVDKLRVTVESLSSKIDKIEKTYIKKPTVGE